MKNTAEGVLEKMRKLVLRRATVGVRKTPPAALEALVVIGPLQNSISLQSAKAHYCIKNAY